MHGDVLYLGDTRLDGPAGYLAGVLTWAGISFDHVPSHRGPTDEEWQAARRLIVVSDYPSALLSAEVQQSLLSQVKAGAGLWMIGGWESFQGSAGGWRGTALGDALPVEIRADDDRVNSDQPSLIRLASPSAAEHPAVADLPWGERPPTVGGWNAVRVKPDAELLLEVVRFSASHSPTGFTFQPCAVHPLLVSGRFGLGRTLALTTDAAPHWVGGLVDWGLSRITSHAPGAEPIEVGLYYAQFLASLARWTAGKTG